MMWRMSAKKVTKEAGIGLLVRRFYKLTVSTRGDGRMQGWSPFKFLLSDI